MTHINFCLVLILYSIPFFRTESIPILFLPCRIPITCNNQFFLTNWIESMMIIASGGRIQHITGNELRLNRLSSENIRRTANLSSATGAVYLLIGARQSGKVAKHLPYRFIWWQLLHTLTTLGAHLQELLVKIFRPCIGQLLPFVFSKAVEIGTKIRRKYILTMYSITATTYPEYG